MDEINNAIAEFDNELSVIRDQVEAIKLASGANEAGVGDIIDKNESTNSTASVLADILKSNQGNTEKIISLVQNFES